MNHSRKIKLLFAAAVASFATLGLAACEDDGSMEEVGEEMDDAVDDIGDELDG